MASFLNRCCGGSSSQDTEKRAQRENLDFVFRPEQSDTGKKLPPFSGHLTKLQLCGRSQLSRTNHGPHIACRETVQRLVLPFFPGCALETLIRRPYPTQLLQAVSSILQTFSLDMIVRRMGQELMKSDDVTRNLVHRICQKLLQRPSLHLHFFLQAA